MQQRRPAGAAGPTPRACRPAALPQHTLPERTSEPLRHMHCPHTTLYRAAPLYPHRAGPATQPGHFCLIFRPPPHSLFMHQPCITFAQRALCTHAVTDASLSFTVSTLRHPRACAMLLHGVKAKQLDVGHASLRPPARRARCPPAAPRPPTTRRRLPSARLIWTRCAVPRCSRQPSHAPRSLPRPPAP